MVRASAKMHRPAFVDFDICQLMPLRNLHPMTLTSFARLQILCAIISEKVRASANM